MTAQAQPRIDTAHIDTSSPEVLATWATKLDATPQQITEAVQAVGDHPEDVELHLKGSRSTTNSERVAAQQQRPQPPQQQRPR